jgi:plasmid stabilization system protein ParE
VRVIWTRNARSELEDIRRDIAALNPHAAKRVKAAIQAAAKPLGQFPYMGHAGDDDAREMVVTKFPSYLLIYDVDTKIGAVYILTVWKQWLPR